MNKPGRQRGLSFTGFLLGAFVLVMVSMVGLKLVPVYMQNSEINKIFVTIANDPEMQKASSREIRASFSKRASINNITVISAEDIVVDNSSGKPVLSASYAVKVPLVGNISLYLDFNSANK